MIEGSERNERGAPQELYELAKDLVGMEAEKAERIRPGAAKFYRKLFDEVDLLASEGRLTKTLEGYLRRVVVHGYDHDIEPVFEKDALFKDGSGIRLFAFFHHHAKPEKGEMIGDYTEPSPRDMALTWRIGPQVLFVPYKDDLHTHMMSIGQDVLVGIYKI
jgi:hypothetical protein